jgi:hypothetical protein
MSFDMRNLKAPMSTAVEQFKERQTIQNQC